MRLSYRAALLAVLSCTSPSALANDEDEIVVTAVARPTPIENLPAAVTVIDADAARARGEVTLDQALANVPGVQAPRTGPLGQQASIFSGGFESNHTLVLFDGVRIDDPSTPEGLFDAGQDLLGGARRIEVVQGPLSAIYGSGALGGAINIVPRRGGDDLHARLEAAAGSFGTIMAGFGADGALGPLRFAVSIEGLATDGYDIVPERIASHSGEADGAEISTAMGLFDYAVSDALAFDLLLRRREARADYDPGFFGNIGENPEAEIKQNDTSLWRLGATWRASEDLTLRLSGGALDADRVTADASLIGDEYHGERRFADLNATWRRGTWTVLAGAQTEDESIDAVSFGSPVIGAQEHWGAYIVAQGAAGSLDFTAAARHDDFEGFGGQTTWRAGASQTLGDSARIYAAFGTSYRAPSLYERFVPFFGAAGLKPEQAQSWEIGGDVRVRAFGRDDGLEFSGLYRASEIEDLIGFFGFSYANVDEAEIRFAEARAAARPLDWLTVQMSYANTDARDVSSGQPLQRRPRHAWSAHVEAERGPFSAEVSWRQVGARLDTIYDDLGFFSGTGRVAAYDVVRASASWAVNDGVRLYLAGDNLLDETYEPVNGFAGAPASLLAGIRVTH
jgi:vitamin B12 transporter